MDVRKVTVIATIAVIALVAVGIGYAYTATTYNSGNSVGSEYIIVTPSADGSNPSYSGVMTAANNKVTWNTVNSSGTVTYTLANPSADANVSGFQKVGTFYLMTNDTNAAALTKFELNVQEYLVGEAASGMDTTHFNFKLVFGYGTSAVNAAANATLNATNGEGHDSAAVKTFYGSEVTYRATSHMTVETADYIAMDVYVMPKVAITGTAPNAFNNVTLEFKLNTYTTS